MCMCNKIAQVSSHITWLENFRCCHSCMSAVNFLDSRSIPTFYSFALMLLVTPKEFCTRRLGLFISAPELYISAEQGGALLISIANLIRDIILFAPAMNLWDEGDIKSGFRIAKIWQNAMEDKLQNFDVRAYMTATGWFTIVANKYTGWSNWINSGKWSIQYAFW